MSFIQHIFMALTLVQALLRCEEDSIKQNGSIPSTQAAITQSPTPSGETSGRERTTEEDLMGANVRKSESVKASICLGKTDLCLLEKVWVGIILR